MSLTLPMVSRTSGSVSFISSLVVSSSSCIAPNVPRSLKRTAARASATIRALIPNAIHMNSIGANTPWRDPTNTPNDMALCGRRLLGRLLRLAAWARHEADERLKQEGEYDRRQHVRLPEVERRQPQIGPQLAQAETERGGAEHREVGTAAVAEPRVKDLGRDEHEQYSHHHARWDEVHRGAPSGPRGWVVLSML